MSAAIKGKYGIITTEKKEFHEGEPVFLLRATDPLAPEAIRHYGFRCRMKECSEDHVLAIYEHAQRMEEWQRKHPELVKVLPD